MSDKQTFFVRGTTCGSCEVVIERELRALDKVKSVDVSHASQQIKIELAGNERVTADEITQKISKHGYRVANKEENQKKKEAINWARIGGVAVIVFGVYLFLDKIGILRFSPTSAEPAGLFAVFTVGLIASVSSCTAVVGGLIAAVSSHVSKTQDGMSAKERFRPHLFFNIGRIAGFGVFGALIGWLGSAIQLSSWANGVFILAIAILMIVLGVNLLNLFPVPVVKMPKWLAHKVHDLSESKSPVAPMALGASTFFLPCGFTQSMQLFALSLQDPFQGAMIMTVFALGTAPALLGIGRMTSVFSGKKLKEITSVAGILVLVLGFSNSLNGLTLLGINPTISFVNASEVAQVKVTSGVQKISMNVTDRGSYDPNVLSVQVGIPVEWSIFGADFLGCANTLVLREFGVQSFINPGPNMVKFTPTKTGKFTYSCSMGMIRGTMVVTPKQT
ncbi:sulfite exporter TauE/SafE family protein [Candidatus Uhrbacteria bacterium]|nr:sulfite exporter TauE/SafE family protein [Candidatus Uhrbacteria bacterium]